MQARSGFADWSGSHIAIHAGEDGFGEDAHIVLFDARGDREPVDLVVEELFGPLSVGAPRFSPDGKRLLAGSSPQESESIFCWDVATGRQLWSRDHDVCYGGVDVGWSSGGDRAFFRCARPLVLEAKTGRALLELGGRFATHGFQSSVRHMALLDDGSTVLAVDGGLTVLDSRGAVRHRWWRFASGSTLLADGRKRTYRAIGDAACWVHARLSDTEVVPLLDLQAPEKR